jgi:hypothetical protein
VFTFPCTILPIAVDASNVLIMLLHRGCLQVKKKRAAANSSGLLRQEENACTSPTSIEVDAKQTCAKSKLSPHVLSAALSNLPIPPTELLLASSHGVKKNSPKY